MVLTGISTAEEPGMVGSGRVPGMEAGRGCLCLFRRCSSEDRDPGTGLKGHTNAQQISDFELLFFALTLNLEREQERKYF